MRRKSQSIGVVTFCDNLFQLRFIQLETLSPHGAKFKFQPLLRDVIVAGAGGSAISESASCPIGSVGEGMSGRTNCRGEAIRDAPQKLCFGGKPRACECPMGPKAPRERTPESNVRPDIAFPEAPLVGRQLLVAFFASATRSSVVRHQSRTRRRRLSRRAGSGKSSRLARLTTPTER